MGHIRIPLLTIGKGQQLPFLHGETPETGLNFFEVGATLQSHAAMQIAGKCQAEKHALYSNLLGRPDNRAQRPDDRDGFLGDTHTTELTDKRGGVHPRAQHGGRSNSIPAKHPKTCRPCP